MGANVSPKHIPSSCLNPHATNLDFALLIQPNSSDFQLNRHFASITLPIDCYAGSNVLACSRPRNSHVLEPRHIAACFDDSALVMVDGIGTSLAGAVGRSASGGGSSCHPLCQCGMGHQAQSVGRFSHRARFTSRATRHTHVGLVPQFPNNARGD